MEHLEDSHHFGDLQSAHQFDALKSSETCNLQECWKDGEQINQTPNAKNVFDSISRDDDVPQVIQGEKTNSDVFEYL